MVDTLLFICSSFLCIVLVVSFCLRMRVSVFLFFTCSISGILYNFACGDLYNFRCMCLHPWFFLGHQHIVVVPTLAGQVTALSLVSSTWPSSCIEDRGVNGSAEFTYISTKGRWQQGASNARIVADVPESGN